jgi:hypothetical protein
MNMKLIRYLEEAFLTKAQLLAACCIDEQELARLQGRRIMPRASYSLRLDVACDSLFGAHSESAHIEYYANGSAAWIGALQTLADDAGAYRMFASRYKAQLAQLSEAGLSTSDDKLGAGLERHIEQEWQHFLDGSYGVCARSGLPEDIATKELSILIIEHITGGRGATALSTEERTVLARAVDLLDAASPPFAPHERERSSRHRLIDQVRARYQL